MSKIIWIRPTSRLLDFGTSTVLFDFKFRKREQAKRKSINQTLFPILAESNSEVRSGNLRGVTIHFFLFLRSSIRNREMNWLCNNQMTSWIDKIWIWFLFMDNHAASLKITENHENHVNSRRDWKLDRSRMVKIKQSRCQTFIFRGKWLFYSKESEMFQLDCFYSAHMECERN